MSSTWTDEELRGIVGATEVQVTSRRPDGTLRPYVTIWGVRTGPDVYIALPTAPRTGGSGVPSRPAPAGSGRAGPSAT